MADVSERQGSDRGDGPEDPLRCDERPLDLAVGRNKTLALTVSRDLYSRKAVLAAAYKLSDRCAILVDVDGSDRWAVFLLDVPNGERDALLGALSRELTDQALREQLEAEFGQLRTLIVAQAFAEGNLLDPARDDADYRADPLGTGQRR